jgi:hypothetical protein
MISPESGRKIFILRVAHSQKISLPDFIGFELFPQYIIPTGENCASPFKEKSAIFTRDGYNSI